MSDTNIDVEDPTIIEVELDDETAIAGGVEPASKAKPAAEGGQAVGTAATRITPATTSAAEEAAASLNEQIRRANAERDAALATATAERAQREAVERAEKQARQRAQNAETEAATSKLNELVSGIEAAERDMASGKTAYKNAHESGDADAMAEANIRMGRATAALDRLTADKQRFEADAARRKDGGDTGEPTSGAGDARETWLRTFAAKPQSWLRAHPDCLPPQFGGNPDRHRAMVQAHERALAGHAEGSDGYYQAVEETLGYRTPTSAAAVTTAAGNGTAEPTIATRAEPAPKRQPIPAAPPSSAPPSAAPGGQARSQTVKLNVQEQEIARLSFPQKVNEVDQDWLKRAYGTYARNKIDAIKDGSIGRKTH